MNIGCRNANESPVQTAAVPQEMPLILFIGDSLTAGYGLDPTDAYPALIDQKIKEIGKSYRVVNAGVSGDTSTDGLNALGWHLESNPAIVVIALGANDALRGIDATVTQKNLSEMIEKIQETKFKTQILLIGMKAPPNMGSVFTRDFSRVYSNLTKTYDVAFIPFLLKDVAAQPHLNLADGIHPNPAGHKIMAETVWEQLKTLI